MRRVFWMGVGAVGAAVAAQRVRRTARRFTPEAVAEQADDVLRRTLAAAREAVAEFRTASAEREIELVTALLVEPEGEPTPRVGARHATRPHDPEDAPDFF